MILKLSNSITKSSKTSGAVSTEKGFLITRNARTATKWVFNNIKMKICFFFGIFLVQLFLWFALLFGLFSVWVLIKMFSSTKILITHAIKGFHRISTRLFTKNYDGARNVFAIRGLSKFRPKQSWVDGLGNYAVPWTLRCHFALNNQLTGLAVVNWVKYKGLNQKPFRKAAFKRRFMKLLGKHLETELFAHSARWKLWKGARLLFALYVFEDHFKVFSSSAFHNSRIPSFQPVRQHFHVDEKDSSRVWLRFKENKRTLHSKT